MMVGLFERNNKEEEMAERKNNSGNNKGQSRGEHLQHGANFELNHGKNPQGRITSGKPTGNPPKERK